MKLILLYRMYQNEWHDFTADIVFIAENTQSKLLSVKYSWDARAAWVSEAVYVYTANTSIIIPVFLMFGVLLRIDYELFVW